MNLIMITYSVQWKIDLIKTVVQLRDSIKTLVSIQIFSTQLYYKLYITVCCYRMWKAVKDLTNCVYSYPPALVKVQVGQLSMESIV